MALPSGRLAFERAIRRSGLPAPARHVALTIATWADIGTALIPERFQPSISVLAEATGMGATTVKRHLSVLEETGWLLRDRPEIWRARKEHARTQYALAMPESAQGHGPERAMPRPGEDHAMGGSGPSHSPDGTKARSAAGHKSSLNSDESPRSTSSSPAEVSDDEPAVEPDVTDGGGGGGSDLRSIAEHITASLDYCDQVPDKQQQAKLTAAILAALEKGWSMRGLARYLLLDNYRPDNPVAFYLSKLSPKKLPDMEPAEPSPVPFRGGARGPMPTAAEYEALTVDTALFGDRPAAPAETWAEASANAQRRMAGVGARGGTDERVAGWDAVKRELAGREHRPYSNPVDDSIYDEPWTVPAPSRPPWCGELECSETDRMRDVEDANGFKFAKPCHKCHPDRARAA